MARGLKGNTFLPWWSAWVPRPCGPPSEPREPHSGARNIYIILDKAIQRFGIQAFRVVMNNTAS